MRLRFLQRLANLSQLSSRVLLRYVGGRQFFIQLHDALIFLFDTLLGGRTVNDKLFFQLVRRFLCRSADLTGLFFCFTQGLEFGFLGTPITLKTLLNDLFLFELGLGLFQCLATFGQQLRRVGLL
ncbi:hypothetical protein D3C80_1354270 [compost metagenome]